MRRQTYGRVASAAAMLLVASAAAAQDISGEVFYQIMPIAWRDSDNDEYRFGDFGGLRDSLDYLERLGITSIYLQPIFPSPAYHGYQHDDASKLNPWFGTEEEFLAFIREAKRRNLKVYLDFVAYGISTGSEWFESAYKNPSSSYTPWLAFESHDNTKFEGYTFRTWNGETLGIVHWNLDHPEPVKLVTRWAVKWLDPNGDGDLSDGVDGFRLDHAYANAPEGWGANIRFWEKWARSLRAVNPDVAIFAEHGDWGNYGTELLTPDGFTAVLTKPFEFAARDALREGKASHLYEKVAATVNAVPAGKFVIAQINDHDSDRIASSLGDNPEALKAAAAILLTQPFPPNLYFGNELGMRGRKGKFGSDANDIPMREPFEWKAIAGPPMSDYYRIHEGAYEHRYSRDNDGISVEEQEGKPGSLLETYRQLIALRRSSPALMTGEYIPIPASSDKVWAFLRQAGDQSVFVAINVSDEAVETKLDLSAFEGSGESEDMLKRGPGPALPPGTASVELPPYGYSIVRVNLQRKP